MPRIFMLTVVADQAFARTLQQTACCHTHGEGVYFSSLMCNVSLGDFVCWDFIGYCRGGSRCIHWSIVERVQSGVGNAYGQHVATVDQDFPQVAPALFMASRSLGQAVQTMHPGQFKRGRRLTCRICRSFMGHSPMYLDHVWRIS